MSTIAAPLRPSTDLLVGTAHAPIDARAVLQRLVVAVVLTVVALAAVVGLLQTRSVAVDVAPPAVQVVVQSGDTVWQLAAEHLPAGMTRQEYAMVIVLHNDVDATALVPGTILELPAAGSDAVR